MKSVFEAMREVCHDIRQHFTKENFAIASVICFVILPMIISVPLFFYHLFYDNYLVGMSALIIAFSTYVWAFFWINVLGKLGDGDVDKGIDVLVNKLFGV